MGKIDEFYYLIINGVVSSKAHEVLNLQEQKLENTEWFFVSYSEKEVAKSEVFTLAFEEECPDNFYKIKASPLVITQEFAKEFDCIPEGWKTIVLFQFWETDLKILEKLNTLDAWHFSSSRLVFCFEENYELVKKEFNSKNR